MNPSPPEEDLGKEVRRLRREVEQLRRVGRTYEEIGDHSRHLTGTLGSKLEAQIAETKRTVEELRAARDEAERAAEAKQNFLANMSHEIRTPMNGVLGMAEMLLDSGLPPAQRECAETILRCGRDLLDLISDVLDLSTIDGGRMEIDVVPLDLPALVAEVLQEVEPTASARGLALLSELADPGPVQGDRGRIRQILANLVDNAIKFTPAGSVTVRLRATPAEEHADVVLEVADTGIGLDPSRLPSLFDPFVQADGGTTRRFGGTGLGLTICRELASLMGGRIEAESEPGEGSIFRVHLPLPRAAVPVAATTSVARTLRVGPDPGRSASTSAEDLHVADPNAAFVALRDAADAGRPFGRVEVDADTPGLDPTDFAVGVRSDPRVGPLELVLRGATPTPPGWIPHPESDVGALDAAIRGSSDPTPGWKVLLVDDNSVNQMVIRRQLEKVDCEVTVTSSGEDALGILSDRAFDLVFLDLQMPGLDGFETAAEARGRGDETPIVALTAHAMPEELERCLEVGMQDTLTKPASLEGLRQALQRWAPAPTAP